MGCFAGKHLGVLVLIDFWAKFIKVNLILEHSSREKMVAEFREEDGKFRSGLP